MSQQRYGLGVASDDNSAVVVMHMGGQYLGDCLTSVVRLNTSSHTWGTLPSLNVARYTPGSVYALGEPKAEILLPC